MTMRFASIAADLFYPDDCNCLACGRPLYSDEHGICGECAASLKRIEGNRCQVCGRPLNKDNEIKERLCSGCRHRPLEQRIYGGAPYNHSDAASRLVYSLKYNNVKAAAQPLIDGMMEELTELSKLHEFDAIAPVPLHTLRERTRGYNQSRILCEGLSDASGIPIIDALKRTRATRQQMKLRADEREGNVKEAFKVVEIVAGMRLILVDDVRTTGLTSVACAEALYMAGALDVEVLTATLAVMHK